MLKIGHRGAPACAPENTIRSFKRALELGATGVEFDIRMTKDNVLAVIHDATVDRTTNGTGLLREKTLADVLKLDAGQGEKIPTLLEALQFLKRKTHIVIEFKERGFLPLFYEIIEATGPWNAGDITILAFNENGPHEGSESSWDDLAAFKQKYPHLAAALLFSPHKLKEPGFDLAKICQIAEDMKADALAPWYKMVSKEMIDFIHNYRHPLKIFTWAVDSKSDIEQLRNWGVDGIASNIPELLN